MTALRMQGETFRPFEAFIMIALLYWLLNEVVAIAMGALQRRWTLSLWQRCSPFSSAWRKLK